MGFPQNWVALSSTATSTYTSSSFLMPDFASISVSVVTTQAVASLITIDGSNDNGLDAAITVWSTITALTAPGLYTIDPGSRWHRVRKSSLDSGTSVAYQVWSA